MKQFLIFVTSILLLTSCHHITGSGNIVSEKRETGNFTAVSSSEDIDVEIKNGPVTEVTVEADDNMIKYIRTRVADGTLKIDLSGNHSFIDVHTKVYITAPLIERINASSSSDVVVKDVLKSTGRISFNASSSADITADVDAPEIDSHASSSGSVKLSGRTRSHTAEASSAGDIRAYELLSENTKVSASSGANAMVHASVSLNASASSGADISYRGAAAIQKNTSSGGSVERKD
jgi:hypothetical protein